MNSSACSRPAMTHTACRDLVLGNVDALDFMRPLGRVTARQPKQPLARAIVGDLLGNDLGPRDREMLFQLRAHVLQRRSSSRRTFLHRGHTSSARAAARASCAAFRARRRSRASPPARRATSRSATAARAAHRFQALSFPGNLARQCGARAASVEGVVMALIR